MESSTYMSFPDASLLCLLLEALTFHQIVNIFLLKTSARPFSNNPRNEIIIVFPCALVISCFHGVEIEYLLMLSLFFSYHAF